MAPGPGIEPGTHWWKASAITIIRFYLAVNITLIANSTSTSEQTDKSFYKQLLAECRQHFTRTPPSGSYLIVGENIIFPSEVTKLRLSLFKICVFIVRSIENTCRPQNMAFYKCFFVNEIILSHLLNSLLST